MIKKMGKREGCRLFELYDILAFQKLVFLGHFIKAKRCGGRPEMSAYAIPQWRASNTSGSKRQRNTDSCFYPPQVVDELELHEDSSPIEDAWNIVSITSAA